MLKKLLKFLSISITFLVGLVILAASIRGISGNPTHEILNRPEFRDEGPLELSPERGRFALIYSIVEDKKFQYELPVAKFVVPDLGYKNGNFVSLFAPGVSFLAIPGYLMGRLFGLSQVGAFAEIGLFAILNSLLIYGISKRLEANKIASLIAAFAFIFATPAFAYAVTLYQHHVTVFLLLSTIYILLRLKTLWSLLPVWIFIVGSVVIDYPNFFLFFPLGIYSIARMFFIKESEKVYKLNFKVLGLLTFLSAIVPITFFLWSNKMSYGDPLQLAGTVRTVKGIDETGNPLFAEDIARLSGQEVQTNTTPKTAVGFFKTRRMLSGLYTHFLSSERGILWYAPVMFFGIFGIFILYKSKPKITALILSIIGINVLLYSMWGDPWGGWAFGSRYLIPTYSLMAIFMAITLTKFSKNILFLLLFYLLLMYSVAVNALGALTTNTVPPKIEAVALEKLSNKKEEYTYIRNWNYLLNKGSKSYFYQTYLKDSFTPVEFYAGIVSIITVVLGGQITVLYLFNKRNK